MILVTRLNGLPFAVNPDLLERVESTPDTVLTLIDGTKYIVTESVGEVIALVRDYRASVVASARSMDTTDLRAAAGGSPAAVPAAERPHPERPRLHLAPVAPVAEHEPPQEV